MEILSSRILLRPTDFARSVRFYRDQLGLAVYRDWPGGVVFFLGNGLLEVSGAAAGPQPAVGPIGMWLQVRDIGRAHAEAISAGVDVQAAPRQRPWGLLERELRDPDGLRIVVVQVPEQHPLRHDSR